MNPHPPIGFAGKRWSLTIGISLVILVAGTAKASSLLEWNLKTTVEAYEKVGLTNSAWDEPARRALTEYARMRVGVVESNEYCGLIIGTNADLAVKAGCADPMIGYLYMRYSDHHADDPKTHAIAYSKVAQDLQKSGYPNIRKFYATLRAEAELYSAFNNNPDRHLIVATGSGTKGDLVEAVKDKTMPFKEVYDACDEGITAYRGTQDLYERLEKPLFENWTNEPRVWLLRGEAYMYGMPISVSNGTSSTN
jgi:hypothetical protein